MSNKITRVIGKIIIKLFGFKTAYYCRYLLDKKALIKELKRGVEQESGKEQMQKATKIAFLFIGTNKYIDFFPKYYETIKKYFLTKTPKDFFVYTDMVDYDFLKDKKDVVIIPVKHQKWPFTTLLRFKMINMASKKLKKYSHIIYIDADMIANSSVIEEEFFSHDKPLFGVRHICYLKKQGEFEFNKESTAAVDKNDNLSNYCAGTFFGGQSKAFLELTKELEKRIDIDLNKNIIAKWHDESQLNKYFIERKNQVHTLDSSYIYSELKPIPKPFRRKFIHLIHNSTKTSTIGRNMANDNKDPDVK